MLEMGRLESVQDVCYQTENFTAMYKAMCVKYTNFQNNARKAPHGSVYRACLYDLT